MTTRRLASFEYDTAIYGDVGVVCINDALVGEPVDAFYFGGLDYKSLAASIEKLEDNPSVNSIVLDFNSPGGYLTGLYEAIGTIAKCSKPVYAFTSGYLCSAAYGLASATIKIYATEAAHIGSIGAYLEFLDDSEYLTRRGLESIAFYGKNSDMKNLDPKSEKGKEVYQAEIDEAEEMFLETIASNRGVSLEKVIKDYGHGQVFFAEEAKNRGMVDAIVPSFEDFINTINGGGVMAGNEKVEAAKTVDVDALVAKATEEAVRAERERVGKINGYVASLRNADIKALASEAVENGKSFEDFKADFADKALELLKEGENHKNAVIKEAEESAVLEGVGAVVKEKETAEDKAKKILSRLANR